MIAYAGTATSWRYRGVFDDTFNIINVLDGKIEIDIKVVGGKRMALSDIVRKYEPSPNKNSLL
jgi:hypothetical protein